MKIFLWVFLTLKVFLQEVNSEKCGMITITEENQFKQLKNCVTIKGSLTFENFNYTNLSFPNLLDIKGYLIIGNVANLTSVKQLLPNLVHIHGESPHNESLVIRNNTDLEKLDFKKLMKISRGDVEISGNPRLCLSDTISWSKTQKLMRPLEKYIQIESLRCSSCPPNRMLFGSECVETCPEKTLNLMNSECISSESCEQENSEYWKKLRFVPSNGNCRLMKYCHNIKVDEDFTKTKIFLEQEDSIPCQVVQGYVDIQFPSESNCEGAINAAVLFLSEIEEIRDYLKVTNSPTVRHLGFLPKLRMIRGDILESGVNSLIFGSHKETSQNYTFKAEEFCTAYCNSSNLTVEITAKTYGCVVKVPNDELKNDDISFKYFVMASTEFQKHEICEPLPSFPQQFQPKKITQEFKIYNLQPNTRYIFKFYSVSALEPLKVGLGEYHFKTLSTFIENVSFVSRAKSLTIMWTNVIEEGYARPIRYELRAYLVSWNETFFSRLKSCSDADEKVRFMDKLLTPKLSSLVERLILEHMTNKTKALFIDELMDESPGRKSSGFEYIYAETGPDVSKFSFEKFLKFAYYFVTIRACYGNYINPDCSNPTYILTKTSLDEDADKVENVKTKSNGSHVELTWDLPTNPNGPILYFIVKNNETKTESCITYQEYKSNDHKIIINDSQTDSITVSMRSVGSNWEVAPTAVKIKLPSQTRQDSRQDRSVIYSLFFVLVIVIVMMASYLLWQRKKMRQTKQRIYYNNLVIVKLYEPDNYEVTRESVELLNEIGEGNFGKVLEGTLRKPDGVIQSVAVKKINEKASLKESTNFLNEASIMKQFDTTHIIQLLGIVSRTKPNLVIMELMTNGDLKNFLRKNRPVGGLETTSSDYTKFELNQIIPPVSHMAIQIADGMAYLEQGKFVHRDLAARNCMVAADYTIKIGDFGLSRYVHKSNYYQGGMDTVMPVRWMAPEFLTHGKFSSQSDVFSYGIVLWEIVTYGEKPHKGLSNKQVVKFVVKGGTEKKPKEKCPENIFELMQRCWKFNPKDRISFIEIIEALIDEAPDSFREHSFYSLRD